MSKKKKTPTFLHAFSDLSSGLVYNLFVLQLAPGEDLLSLFFLHSHELSLCLAAAVP